MNHRLMLLASAALTWLFFAAPALALDQQRYDTARQIAAKAIAWLRTQQDSATGGWAVNPQGPQYPAITGLVVNGLILDPAIDATDPAVRKGVEFMLKYKQPDGGRLQQVEPELQERGGCWRQLGFQRVGSFPQLQTHLSACCSQTRFKWGVMICEGSQGAIHPQEPRGIARSGV
jgi:hypothetical protein